MPGAVVAVRVAVVIVAVLLPVLAASWGPGPSPCGVLVSSDPAAATDLAVHPPVVASLHAALDHVRDHVRVAQLRAGAAVCMLPGAHRLSRPAVLHAPDHNHLAIRALSDTDAAALPRHHPAVRAGLSAGPTTLTGAVEIPVSSCTPVAAGIECPLPGAVPAQPVSHLTLQQSPAGPRIPPARFPQDLAQYLTVNTSTYTRAGEFRITVAAAGMPSELLQPGSTMAADFFPLHSWVNLLGTAVSRGAVAPGLAAFDLACPPPDAALCTNTSNHLVVVPGTRVAFLHRSSLLTAGAAGLTWTLLGNRLVLSQKPSTGSLFLSVNHTVVAVEGVTGASLSGLTFSGTTFVAPGYQEGFNAREEDPGMPHDAAVRVWGSTNITIANCSFTNLGGGGVHVHRSEGVRIASSLFSHLGQSGVVLTGNDTTQATHVVVQGNTMDWVGEILASAAGVLASSVSDTVIENNTIQHGSRWGVAIRSNGNAGSYRNTVRRNIVKHTGLRTRDLGGLSFIGRQHTGSVVDSNCVRDVQGHDTDLEGRLLTPFFVWSLYLDNWSSGFTVTNNILSGNVRGGVFFHGGDDNVVRNNILHNASNYNVVPLGHQEMDGQVAYGVMGGSPPGRNNSFERNIVVFPDTGHLHGTNVSFLRAYQHMAVNTSLLHSEGNLVFKRGTTLAPLPMLTPAGTLAQWRATGQDTRSLFDVDPLLADPAAGDFTLSPNSPALRLGFQPIDPDIARACGP